MKSFYLDKSKLSPVDHVANWWQGSDPQEYKQENPSIPKAIYESLSQELVVLNGFSFLVIT